MGNGVDDRRTPPDLFKRYDDLHHFTLDAAASHENALCPIYCTPDGTFRKGVPDPAAISGQHGLSYPWHDEVVWCNPPYSRGNLVPFVEKAHAEAKWLGKAIVMLLPVRTEQGWFQDIVLPDVEAGRAKIDFLRGRLRFSDLGAAPFPSMVVTWNG